MKQPIKSGDMAVVITGLGREKSPNIGLTVGVLKRQGEHSQFGTVWRCAGEGLKQLTDGGGYQQTDWADIPASWLQKIEPDSKSTAHSKELELSK